MFVKNKTWIFMLYFILKLYKLPVHILSFYIAEIGDFRKKYGNLLYRGYTKEMGIVHNKGKREMG